MLVRLLDQQHGGGGGKSAAAGQQWRGHRSRAHAQHVAHAQHDDEEEIPQYQAATVDKGVIGSLVARTLGVPEYEVDTLIAEQGLLGIESVRLLQLVGAVRAELGRALGLQDMMATTMFANLRVFS